MTYFNNVQKIVDSIKADQTATIEQEASFIAHNIARGGILHIFGSGHSHMIAEDIFHRAGGLTCVNAMLEPSLMETNVGRASNLERLSGYAHVLLSGYELRKDEALIVVSNSGINAVPIEIAAEARDRGLRVIAITSVQHSLQCKSRHSSGKRLMEVADSVIDTHVPFGDASIKIDGKDTSCGPVSTIAGLVIVQSIVVAVIEKLLELGVEPPVFQSANTPCGDEHNDGFMKAYGSRVRYS